MASTFGIVVIGRNEGKRLRASLSSIASHRGPLVYVDSASEDGSRELALSMGVQVLSVDAVSPGFARNRGASYLLEQQPGIRFFQFLDGDTCLAEGWIEEAFDFLNSNPDIGIVVGRLVEEDPDLNLYTKASSFEWDGPSGDIDYCGGNMAVRKDVFDQLHGFDPDLKAGEDPEFCTRIRQAGWRIHRLPFLMGVHETKVSSFADFWKRCERTGASFQKLSWAYRNNSEERLFFRENLSNWFYGGILPCIAVILILLGQSWAWALFLIYPLLFLRIYFKIAFDRPPGYVASYALLCVLSKFPGFTGALKYLLSSIKNIPSHRSGSEG